MRRDGLLLLVAIGAAGMAPVMAQTATGMPRSFPASPATSTVEQPAQVQKLASQLDEQAQPAAIDFAGGTLTIRAANSSLRAILNDLQLRTGTKINGLTGDERIYGVYGPGNAQSVLAALLDDSGYNVLISGRNADGAPRQIELSSRTSIQAAAPQTPGVTQAAAEADDSDDTDASPPTTFTPPPQLLPAPTPAASGTPPQIKTPQQMLQELQQMRQNAQQQTPQ
jgi:hypothetical protein